MTILLWACCAEQIPIPTHAAFWLRDRSVTKTSTTYVASFLYLLLPVSFSASLASGSREHFTLWGIGFNGLIWVLIGSAPVILPIFIEFLLTE